MLNFNQLSGTFRKDGDHLRPDAAVTHGRRSSVDLLAGVVLLDALA